MQINVKEVLAIKIALLKNNPLLHMNGICHHHTFPLEYGDEPLPVQTSNEVVIHICT